MYHSVNMSYVLISTDSESEDLKPMEKALRSKEVTILSKFVFISGNKNNRRFSMDEATSLGVLFYLTRRITCLVESVVNSVKFWA